MKLSQFQQQLQKRKVDHALLISGETTNPHLLYLTQLPKLTHAALLIPKKGKPSLFVSPLDYERVKKTRSVKVILLRTPLLKHLKNYKLKTLGLDFNHTYSSIKKIKKEFPKISDISPLIQTLREVKTPEEIKFMAKAASIANAAFKKIATKFHSKTEAEVAAALEYEMAKNGASPAFPTIVASGKNAATPHHATTTKPLQKGFCVIDFGANYNGYCSDCTRTIYIGKQSAKEKEIYTLVLNAQQQALNAVKPGMSCQKLDAIARNQLKMYKKYFIHALGHGIGVEVHENPTVSQKSKGKLKQNMVITIEPGIYIPNKFGIRIEDTVVVGDKPHVLTSISKELVKKSA